MRLRLILPSRAYLDSFNAASGEERIRDGHPEIDESYILHMRSAARGAGLVKGEIPRTEYWLVDGKQYLGRIQIRHTPSGSHPSIESHVYYEVRASQRHKGYGTKMLGLGLRKARGLGLMQLIIACAEDNIASRRVVEKNGGVRISSKHVPGHSVVMVLYRLETTPETRTSRPRRETASPEAGVDDCPGRA